MKIYIMRHGTTCWNEQGIIQGRRKNRLSKTGKQLVIDKAQKNANTHFDIIISSPVMRAVQTANIMKKNNKSKDLKIIKDDRISEIDAGLFAGRKGSTLSKQEREDYKNRSVMCKMEKWIDVHKRVGDFLRDITKKYTGKSVLIVTHDTPAEMIENYLLNKQVDYENQYVYAKNFANAEIRKYIIYD